LVWEAWEVWEDGDEEEWEDGDEEEWEVWEDGDEEEWEDGDEEEWEDGEAVAGITTKRQPTSDDCLGVICIHFISNVRYSSTKTTKRNRHSYKPLFGGFLNMIKLDTLKKGVKIN